LQLQIYLVREAATQGRWQKNRDAKNQTSGADLQSLSNHQICLTAIAVWLKEGAV
jgi:hypothetical protein